MPIISSHSRKGSICIWEFDLLEARPSASNFLISPCIDLALESLNARRSELMVVIYISLSLLVSLWCPHKMIDLQSISSSVESWRVKTKDCLGAFALSFCSKSFCPKKIFSVSSTSFWRKRILQQWNKMF